MLHSTQASHSLYVREGPCPGILSHYCAASLHSHMLNTLHVRQHLNASMLLSPNPVHNTEHSRLCGRLCAPPSHLQRTTPPLLLLLHPQYCHLVKQTPTWLPAEAGKVLNPEADQQVGTYVTVLAQGRLSGHTEMKDPKRATFTNL